MSATLFFHYFGMFKARPRDIRFAGFLLAIACTSSAHAQFKCVDRENRVTYQQHHCPLNDQSTPLRNVSVAPSTPTESNASAAGGSTAPTPTAKAGSSSGRTYRGEPCPTASEMAELDSKIAKMRQKNPDIPDGTREMFLTAALKTREEVKKACG